MKLAIMQPYFFPYIGYFQLIYAVDKFVFYDDVNYIKNGWINRNRILINNQPSYFTIQLKGASPFKLINQIEFTDNRAKLKKTIQIAYRKAPFFNQVFPIIEQCLDYETNSISKLAIKTIEETAKYMNVNTSFEISSYKYADTKELERTERIITLCRINNAQTYINASGGTDLYSKEEFQNKGISLFFIKPQLTEYKQYNTDRFIPGLSVIDVMMFNSVKEIHKMLNNYDLI